MSSTLYMSIFWWKSDLSLERRQELVDWVNALPKAQQEMIADLRQDARDEALDETE